MGTDNPLVSIGLPVRNGEPVLASVVESVLAQTYPNLELVISDNASTDGTEELCRELARADARITYHRHSANVGILNNFVTAMRLANGTFFRWIGDDDALAPDWASRCVEVFAEDQRRVLVTTQIAYLGADGATRSAPYAGTGLASDDPVERFAEMLRVLNDSHLVLDPLYGLIRRATIAALPRRIMLCEDEVFAARLALAGPWAHIPEVLARRVWKDGTFTQVARLLGVPAWQARVPVVLQCRELLRHVRDGDLDPEQRRRARGAVAKFYLGSKRRTLERRGRRLAEIAGRLVGPRRSSVTG